MRSVGNEECMVEIVECKRYGVWEMRSVENEEYGK